VTKRLVVTIGYPLPDGSASYRTWPISEKFAEHLADMLGEPIQETLTSPSELEEATRLTNSLEAPLILNDDYTERL